MYNVNKNQLIDWNTYTGQSNELTGLCRREEDQSLVTKFKSQSTSSIHLIYMFERFASMILYILQNCY